MNLSEVSRLLSQTELPVGLLRDVAIHAGQVLAREGHPVQTILLWYRKERGQSQNLSVDEALSFC